MWSCSALSLCGDFVTASSTYSLLHNTWHFWHTQLSRSSTACLVHAGSNVTPNTLQRFRRDVASACRDALFRADLLLFCFGLCSPQR